jgi:hypothetical protein
MEAQKRKRPLVSGRLLRSLGCWLGYSPLKGDPGDVRPGDAHLAELAVALAGQFPKGVAAKPPGPQKTNDMNKHIQAPFIGRSQILSRITSNLRSRQ